MSTAEAMATCAMSEYQWLTSLGVDTRLIGGIRYVDDVSGCISYKKSSKKSYERAKSLLERMKSECYPKELILKEEDMTNGKYRYLETTISVKGAKISPEFFSKNFDFILKNGEQKFYTLQSNDSFSSNASKVGVIISRFMAIQSNSVSNVSLFCAVGSFYIAELDFRGYGKKTL